MNGRMAISTVRARLVPGEGLGFFRLLLVIAVGLVLVLGGIYAVSAQGTAKVGALTSDRLEQDIGDVPYDGGLGKATYTLAAQGGPVTVTYLTTT